MNAVGIFAGRGDVVLAMGLALLIGMWVGWQLHRFKSFLTKQ
jgi:hypothetical protein